MKHKNRLRWVSILLTTLLLLPPLTLQGTALTPDFPITGAYRSSTYHQNLQNIPRTGDKAFDAVAAAMTQVGYHEGNGTADFGGKNASGYKNYTEYNRVFGKVDGTYGYAWCAAFVSWCLTAADATDAAGGLYVSCSLWLEQLRSTGQYSSRASGYSPKEGDLIFFRSSGAGRASDHVGLVRYVEGGRVYTVEGNSSDRVSLNSYTLSNTYIVGYGKPNYGENLIPSTAFSMEDKTLGWYIVTNDFVNVRTGAGTSFSKSGKLYRGDLVRVFAIQNGFGAILSGGNTRYISLDYADFVSPISHRVIYDANGGEGAPANASYYSYEARFASHKIPLREGYRFVAWEASDSTRYTGGDQLPVADLTLTAVWEAIPVIEPPTAEPEEPEPPTPEPLPEPAPDEDVFEGSTDEGLLSPGNPATPDPAPWPDSPVQTLPQRTTADAATTTVLLLAAAGVSLYILWRKKRGG
ncbi:MAG: CHAP domain-containing protein [Clostridia bacterium]|nr:CHAP domain-containing protein [Clostridia bacterium]